MSDKQFKKPKVAPVRTTALCYVRQSFTRNATDMDSPERQRANIEAICERNGWTAEFYEDAEKHKSGTKEHNRPGWLALKARLGDPDVVALVANDLARLHRKGWRVGDLIDFLDKRGVTLVLAAPGREIDLSTPMGRLFVQFTAILDEWYAADISQRAKDSVAHRRAKGQTIGMPPFGTVRGKDGFLHPSSHGAWLLSDGNFVSGTEDTPPEESATFKGYYEAAERILQLYATGKHGLDKIAYLVNDEGWAFRDRAQVPRPIDSDDVRRVVANWSEYGGIPREQKATARRAYELQNIDEIPFRSDRAVFPIELVKKVAQVRQERTRKPADHGKNNDVRFYALTGITYCAHCERLAAEENSPHPRSLLSGQFANNIPRYRHKPGVTCGISNRSVPTEELEDAFMRLIGFLEIKPEAQHLMLELAIQADKSRQLPDEPDFEQQKAEALALCYRRIDAAVNLYRDGTIDRTEYLRTREQNEREIAHWESRTSSSETMALEFAVCIEAVDKIARLWSLSSVEDRQGLARSIFSSIIYDLDRKRIVNFRLKPWAERFLTIRAEMYGEQPETKTPQPESQGVCTEVLHTGFEPVS